MDDDRASVGRNGQTRTTEHQTPRLLLFRQPVVDQTSGVAERAKKRGMLVDVGK